MASLKSRMDRWTTRAANYAYRQFRVEYRRHRPLEIVYEKAAEQSADFILANLSEAVLFDDRKAYWRFLLSRLVPTGLIMECGVFKDQLINFIADQLSRLRDMRTVFGFDSFEGLEEDWTGENLAAGHFNLDGNLPMVRPLVQLKKGWVQETVSSFLAEHPNENIGLLHIDTDSYTPARYLLEAAKSRFSSGTIIAFDELIGYPNWQRHEYRALTETLELGTYEFIAFTSRQAAIRINSAG